MNTKEKEKAFEPLWAAWKGGDEPNDPDHSENKKRFIATASALLKLPNPTGAEVDCLALEYLRDTREETVARARSLCESSPSGRLKVHRGLHGCGAVRLRIIHLNDEEELRLSTDRPYSYSGPHGTAVTFARKGPTLGFLYSVEVDESEIVYVDDANKWNFEGVERENEIVVWHRNSIPSTLKVIEHAQEPGSVTHRNNTDRRTYEENSAALFSWENQIRQDLDLPLLSEDDLPHRDS